MQTGHELFVHGLSEMLDGERQLLVALQELESDSTNQQLKHAFAVHRKETQNQIERLNQSLELIGESPEPIQCKGIKGIIEEKKALMDEDPSEDILDVFNIRAAAKAEAYEICEYESLIQLSREMKHAKVAQLLSQTLKEEQAVLKKMEAFSKKIKPKEMMTEEEEARASEHGKVRARRAA